MPIDPGLGNLLQAMSQMNLKGFARGSADEARTAFRKVTVDLRAPDVVIPVGSVFDLELPGPAGRMAARVYRPDPGADPDPCAGLDVDLELDTATGLPDAGPDAPEDAGPDAEPEGSGGPKGLPTILFMHGGGWVIGDLDTHDNQARRLCREVRAVVVSVEYRLAPEHPFPAAVEDCWAALRWVAAHVAELGGDPGRIAVAGDSAGGNLAAVLARRARDAGGPALAAQLLLYPGTDLATRDEGTYPSRTENAEGKLLTGEDIVWFASAYLGLGPDGTPPDGLDPAHPDLSPLKAPDLSGLAPAVVVVAEFDPLRDEGEAYAWALEGAGNPVKLARMDGMIHGFFDLGPISPAVEEAAQLTSCLLKDILWED